MSQSRVGAESLSSRYIAILLLILCLLGCGGGTSGSGGGSGLQVSGSLRSKQGAPASGVSVTATALASNTLKFLRTQDVVTDVNGAFTVFVDAMPNEDVKLTFQASTYEASFVVTNIPSKAALVQIALTYDDEASSLYEDDVKYEDENGDELRE